MVTQSVNKTALHPGGVVPQVEHTEIEEELHERAHIDYDRVAIIANPSVPALYEDALVYETGSAITSTGALSAYSGAKTGRSPSDKRIVKEESSENEIWWGPVNKPMSPDVSAHHPRTMASSPFSAASSSSRARRGRAATSCPFALPKPLARIAPQLRDMSDIRTALTCKCSLTDISNYRSGVSTANALSTTSTLATASMSSMATQDGTSVTESTYESSVLVPTMLSSCGTCSSVPRGKSWRPSTPIM